MTTCVRGCTVRKQHAPDCPAEDWTEGYWHTATTAQLAEACNADLWPHVRNRDHASVDMLAYTTCLGCKPREAKHGLLCATCHRIMLNWLDPSQPDEPETLMGAYVWLTRNVPKGSNNAARQDWETRGGGKSAPMPLTERVFDQRAQLERLVSGLLRDLCSLHGLVGPGWWHERLKVKQARLRGGEAPAAEVGPSLRLPQPGNEQDMRFGLEYLWTWLDRIEADTQTVRVDGWRQLALIEDWYATIGQAMEAAHKVCPWRPEMKRCRGVECPECQRTSLVFKGGQSFATCLTCGATYDREVYDRWSSLLAHEAKQRAKGKAA